MIWSDLISTAAFVAMAFAVGPNALLVLAFLSALSETPFRAGSVAAIPALVGDEAMLSKANGWIGIGTNIGIMVGPPIGGLLAGWIGAENVFLVNAASFLVSSGLVYSIRAKFRSGEPADEAVDVTGGFKFLLHDRVILIITVSWMVLLLGIGMGIVSDRPLADTFGVGATGFGFMIGLWGAGSVLGSWLATRLRSEQEPVALVAGFVLAGVAGIAIWLSPVFAFVLVANVFWGIGDAVTVVAEQGIIQRRTPDHVRARVVAANEGLVHLGLMTGFLQASPVMDAIGPQATYAIGGVAALAAGALSLTVVGRARADALAGTGA
jgi:predicted MFS family arabinose efflux permease